MTGRSERRSREFFSWESRGRGFLLWEHPVAPEPPFRPYIGERLDADPIDDGRKATFLSGLLRKVSERLAPPEPQVVAESEDESVPERFERGDLVEIRAHLPADSKFTMEAHESFFKSVATVSEPIAFEIVSDGERVAVQFTVASRDERLFRRQLEAFFPDVSFEPTRGSLEAIWQGGGSRATVVEFGLGKEFVIPITTSRADPFVGLVGALSEIERGEVAVFQVIHAPVRNPWEESIIRSVTHADGSALFVNAPELLPGAREKTAKAMYAAVIRIAVSAEGSARVQEIATNLAGALGAYGSQSSNELVPIRSEGYPPEAHEDDLLRRQSRRSGMFLNSEELAGFVHLPNREVASPRLRQVEGKTKAAPTSARRGGLTLGKNVHHGAEVSVSLSADERMRHMHVIGASGTGKSSLLFNMARQDAEAGVGFTVIEPHGDLIDRILEIIPPERAGDVVLIDPSDERHTVGFNILSARGDWEKSLLASDLVSVFRRNSTSWGDQLNSVLQNAILAILESDRGGTLLDLRRFLLEPAFRNEFLKSVRDENLLYYWHRAFPSLPGGKSVGSVVTRLDAFLSPRPIRYMVGQRQNRVDFADIMDSGKILLAKLSQGAIGRDNSHLLGSLLVAKIQSEAMARQRRGAADRRDHILYVDEFHDFLTPSIAECLSGVRKYRLGLVLSHQEMRQVEREPDVASALLANAYTRVVFRVGDRDARTLEGGFSSFEAKDLQNLETGRAVCRVEKSGNDFNLQVSRPAYPSDGEARERRELVVETSRSRYGTLRSEIEKQFAVDASPLPPATSEKKKRTPPVAEVLGADAIPAPVQPPAPPAEPPPQEPKPLPDLGRGGAQHKAIQDRVKDAAETLGYRVTVEKEILSGLGRVDLVFEREGDAVACEISVTTTIDHEVGNVVKCAKAGFAHIAVVTVSDEKLAKMTAAVGHSLGPQKSKMVSFHLPDAFIDWLKDRAAKETPAPKPPDVEPERRSRGGRIVRRNLVTLSPDEAKEREDEMHRVMAEAMKATKRKK